MTVPWRVGTTSYILPDHILPNVCFLADKVDDVELVLFEVDDGFNSLPPPEVIAELADLAAIHDLTFTVHLPCDLELGESGNVRDVSLAKVRKIIECTRPVEPWAYIVHLNGKHLRDDPCPADLASWQENSIHSLEVIGDWAGGLELLAVENLEGYPLEFIQSVVEQVPVSRCVDIGHLWVDNHDPLPYLRSALSRTRVIHLHGFSERDHKSLEALPQTRLDSVVRFLLGQEYSGVLTLEVFNESDYWSSVSALERSISDIRDRGGPWASD